MRSKALKRILSYLVLAAGIFLVLFYIFFRERTEYHVDVTDTLLWADAMVKSGSLRDPGFWYAYMIPFSGTLVMAPFVKFLGVTYLTHKLGMAAFSLIFMVSVYFMLRVLEISYERSALITGVFIILLCASRVTRMIFFCHVIHYSLGILFTCVAMILLKKMTDCRYTSKRTGYVVSLIFLMFWIFCCCINGVSSFMFFLIPFAGAFVLGNMIRFNRSAEGSGDEEVLLNGTFKAELRAQLARPFLELVLMMGAAAGGFLFKILYIGKNEYESHFSSFLPSDEWMFKNNRLINQWVALFTDDVYGTMPFLSKEGIFLMAGVLMALLTLVVPVLALVYFTGNRQGGMKLFFVLDYAVVFLLTIYIYSISTVSNENWRLCELYGMSLLVLLVFTDEIFNKTGFKAPAVLLALLTAFFCLICTYKVIVAIPGELYSNRHDRMVRLLNENGLRAGYSDLYNSANIVTVLSDSSIMVSPIEFNPDGTYNVYRYQSRPEWYAIDSEEYFVVVNGQEREWTEERLKANCSRELQFDEDTWVLVFDRNIFEDLEPVF
ncbi:MAG: hypothetical protein K5886_07780 [Lachnospiraceae bacterium]|nr:hypothetical protein [Lachnospiraceae bacterium]